jgi:hypothetical protein
MNLLLDILDAMTIAVPVIFLCTLVLLSWLGMSWLRERRARRKDRDHETKIRRQWDMFGFDAWLEQYEREQECER